MHQLVMIGECEQQRHNSVRSAVYQLNNQGYWVKRSTVETFLNRKLKIKHYKTTDISALITKMREKVSVNARFVSVSKFV